MSESDRISRLKQAMEPELAQPGSAWVDMVWPLWAFEDCGSGTRSVSMQFDPMVSGQVTINLESGDGERLSASIAFVDLERALRIARATMETRPNAHPR